MRTAKISIRDALASSDAITRLVPATQIHSTERAVLPVLPSIELIAIDSERTDRPIVKHTLSCEITVSSPTEDDADEVLNAVVQAVRARLSAAEAEADPIVLPDGSTTLIELGAVQWSVSAGGSGGIVRGAAIGLSVSEVDEVGGHE